MLQRPALHNTQFPLERYQPPLDSPLSPLRHDRGQRRRKLRSQRRTAQGRDCQRGRLTMRRCLAPLAPPVSPSSLTAPSPFSHPLTSFFPLRHPPHPPPPPRDRPLAQPLTLQPCIIFSRPDISCPASLFPTLPGENIHWTCDVGP